MGKQAIQLRRPLVSSVAAFRAAIYEDPILKMYLRMALDSIPSDKMLAQADPEVVFSILSVTTTSPPQFLGREITGMPFYLLFLDFLDARYSHTFFANPIVNYHFKHIFDEYQAMLSSSVSL